MFVWNKDQVYRMVKVLLYLTITILYTWSLVWNKRKSFLMFSLSSGWERQQFIISCVHSLLTNSSSEYYYCSLLWRKCWSHSHTNTVPQYNIINNHQLQQALPPSLHSFYTIMHWGGESMGKFLLNIFFRHCGGLRTALDYLPRNNKINVLWQFVHVETRLNI